LARLAGGALLAASASWAIQLLFAGGGGGGGGVVSTSGSGGHLSNKPERTVLASQFLFGLMVVIASLMEDFSSKSRVVDDGEVNDPYRFAAPLTVGAIVLVAACFGFMASFWPRLVASSSSMVDNDVHREESRRPRSNDADAGGADGDGDGDGDNGNGLRTPLLADQDEEAGGGDNVSNAENSEAVIVSSNCDNGEARPAETETDTEEASVDPDHPSSRLRGTRRLISLAAPQMPYLWMGCAVLLIRLPFSLSIPHFVSTTLGALSRADYSAAKTEILLLFVMGTIDAALDFWCVFLFGYANLRIVRGVRLDVFAAILRQEVAFFDSHTTGELSSRLSSDCGEMASDLTWFFRFSVESVVRICGIVSYMLIRSPLLGCCAVAIVPVVGVVNRLYGQWLGRNARQVQDALADANNVAQETFGCVRTVIAFAGESDRRDKYGDMIQRHYRLNVRQLYAQGFYYMTISTFLINTCVQSALLLIGTALIHGGRLSVEVLLAFMLYQGQLQGETMNVMNSYTSLVKSSGAGDKVFALLDRKPPPPGTGSDRVVAGERDDTGEDDSIEDVHGYEDGDAVEESEAVDNGDAHDDTEPGEEPEVLKEDGSKAGGGCSLALRDVSFAYPCRPSRPVLSGMTLEIPPGSTVALVGPSGCGKSTVINLLERFYDPLSGCVLVDGRDLRRIDVKAHRRRVGIVTQDPVLFSGTIRSNVSYGRPAATQEEIVRAARLANAHDFVSAFPDGYDTEVGERGTQLSGGQRQRIVIARAVAKDPDVLLLDEATSALDLESEGLVQEALDRLLAHRAGGEGGDDHAEESEEEKVEGGRRWRTKRERKKMTTIVIAHRLQTVRNADCIAVMDGGRVAESGTHDELVRMEDGLYRKMVMRSNGDGMLMEEGL